MQVDSEGKRWTLRRDHTATFLTNVVPLEFARSHLNFIHRFSKGIVVICMARRWAYFYVDSRDAVYYGLIDIDWLNT